MAESGIPSAPQKVPGFPGNFDMLTFDGFQGLNTKPTRPAIEDQQCFILDNVMPLGKNNARWMHDVGTALYSASSSLSVSFFNFGNIADVAHMIVFLSDGSIVQVHTATGASATVAPAGTILDPTQAIGMAQWGSQYILVVAPQTDGYFILDDNLLYQAGTVGPTVTINAGGAKYTSLPNVNVYGGSGTGVTLSPTINSSGSVTQILVTNPGSGYLSNDYAAVAFSGGGAGTAATAIATAVLNSANGVGAITVVTGGSGYTGSVAVQLIGGGGFGATASATVSNSGGPVATVTTTDPGQGYTSAPTVVITDVNNPVAQATVTLMPFGVQGTAIETFSSRVWIVNGHAPTNTPPKNRGLFSAPGSPVDFSPANGAGSFLATDSFLRVGYHALKQSNGFLYLIGDSSVNYISGVNTSGSPPITTFNNQNVDPQIGSPWPNTVQVYSRAVVFANTFGVHAMYGGAVQKVSGPLDGIYTSVTPTGTKPAYGALVPSSAVAIIFGIHVYMLLLPILDQVTGVQTNKLLCWDGNRWWTASQSVSFTQIASQEINSVLTAYGTDGSFIYPLFQTPSAAITKTVQSKFWDKPTYIMTKTPNRLWGLFQENIAEQASFVVTVESEANSQDITQSNTFLYSWTNNAGQAFSWTNNSMQPFLWLTTGLATFVAPVNNVAGVLMGMTITSAAKDLTLISMTLGLQDYRMNM